MALPLIPQGSGFRVAALALGAWLLLLAAVGFIGFVVTHMSKGFGL